MRFVAIDVETANRKPSSICQIGIVVFDGGVETFGDSLLIDPGCDFDPVNVGIHGISSERCAAAPRFSEVWSTISPMILGEWLVSHSPFDRAAILGATQLHNLPAPDFQWCDSCRLAKAVWPEYADAGGYSLSNLGKTFGIKMKHHDALSDARVAGSIVVRALAETQLSIESLSKLEPSDNDTVGAPKKSLFSNKKILKTAPTGRGILSGQVVVFTGDMAISRAEAAGFAASAGATVANSVTRHTTLLVVGRKSLELGAGDSKSGKETKAEALIALGQPIKKMTALQFLEALNAG